MAHIITQIRDKIVANMTALAEPIHVDRVHALEKSDLPCVLVNVADENASQAGYGGGLMLDRSLTVGVAAYVMMRGDFDAASTAIQLEIEKVMASDISLGGLVTNTRYIGRQKSTSGDGDAPFCALGLTYSVTYRTMADSPDVGA